MKTPVSADRSSSRVAPRVGDVARRGRAAVEAVEPRRLLAASIVLNDEGDVIATGTEGADVITAERVGMDDIRITVNSLTRTFDLDDLDSIRLSGLGGNDRITTSGPPIVPAEVVMDGGGGTDTLTVPGGHVVLLGGETIRANGRTVAARQADGGLLVFGTAGADRIQVSGSREADGENVQIDDYFHGAFGNGQFAYFAVNAGAGNDNMRSEGPFETPIRFNGQDGNDFFFVDGPTFTSVTGGAGNDRVQVNSLNGLTGFNGGTGTDTIDMNNDETGIDLRNYPGVENVDNGAGTIIGNELNNRIVASLAGSVNVRGGAGNDTIFGSVSPDQLFGEGGNDTIYGNEGDDLLDGGPGTDQLDGGPGNDTIISGEVAPPPPQIFISNRTLVANGTITNDVFNVVRSGGDDVIVTVNDLSRRFDMDDFDAIRFSGGEGNDSMRAGAGVAGVTMLGGNGNDRLEGNDLAGVLRGGAGDDTLLGNGGVDALFGEAGLDQLFGGDGDDFLDGGADSDILRGDGGADRMFGGDGFDEFEAADGTRDELDGGAGFDRARVDSIDALTSIEQSEVTAP